MSEQAWETIESGVPDPMPLMHPVMRKNYGQWKWHGQPKDASGRWPEGLHNPLSGKNQGDPMSRMH